MNSISIIEKVVNKNEDLQINMNYNHWSYAAYKYNINVKVKMEKERVFSPYDSKYKWETSEVYGFNDLNEAYQTFNNLKNKYNL